MPSSPIPFRLPPALVARLGALAESQGLRRSDIVRLAIMRVLEVAELNPSALLKFAPELLPMDGRRSASMTQSALLVADRFPETRPVNPSPKKVNYRKVLAADR